MTSCIDLLNNISTIIGEINTDLVKNMMDSNVDYNLVCKIPGLTFDHYYKTFASRWDKLINNYINNSDKCSSNMQTLLFLYDLQKEYNVKNISSGNLSKNLPSVGGNVAAPKVEQYAIDAITNILTMPQENVRIKMETDLVKYMKNLAYILLTYCNCQLIDAFTYVIGKYKYKYTKKLTGKTKKEASDIIKNDYEYVKHMLRKYASKPSFNVKMNKQDLSIFNFSIETELQKLIPD